MQYVCNLILTEISSSISYKVSGLAQQIYDNSTLGQKFQELIANDAELKSNKQALDRQVTTHWNSDFDCLYSHLYFKTVVQSMTGVTENKLKAYRLSDDQWDLAEDLQAVLVVFYFYFISLLTF